MGSQRLIAIILLLEKRGHLTAREIAEALHTTERTVHRDMALLSRAGLRVEGAPGRGGGFSLDPGYSDGFVCLADPPYSDTLGLFVRGMGALPEREVAAGLELESDLTGLEATVAEPYRGDISVGRARFHFDTSPWLMERSVPTCLATLRPAVLRSERVLIEYQKRKGKLTDRIVRPYGLVVRARDWYLVGYCERRNEVRVFPCDRIASATNIGQPFEIPEGFSLERYWAAKAADYAEGPE